CAQAADMRTPPASAATRTIFMRNCTGDMSTAEDGPFRIGLAFLEDRGESPLNFSFTSPEGFIAVNGSEQFRDATSQGTACGLDRGELDGRHRHACLLQRVARFGSERRGGRGAHPDGVSAHTDRIARERGTLRR